MCAEMLWQAAFEPIARKPVIAVKQTGDCILQNWIQVLG